MSQQSDLLKLFHDNHNFLTLGEILRTPLAAEYRARMSELRKNFGYIITLERGPRPSENAYRLIEPEANGQLRMA